MLHVFDHRDEMDRDLLELYINEHATSPVPRCAGYLKTDASRFEQLCAEGRGRSSANASMRGDAWNAGHQHTPGHTLTVDEVGRVAEGGVEDFLGIDVAAVLPDATDARPDIVRGGVRFDIKAACVRPGDTFSVPCWQVDGGRYDALLLVQHIEPGRARLWVCKCDPSSPAWERRPGVRGKADFYLIHCGD